MIALAENASRLVVTISESSCNDEAGQTACSVPRRKNAFVFESLPSAEIRAQFARTIVVQLFSYPVQSNRRARRTSERFELMERSPSDANAIVMRTTEARGSANVRAQRPHRASDSDDVTKPWHRPCFPLLPATLLPQIGQFCYFLTIERTMLPARIMTDRYVSGTERVFQQTTSRIVLEC